MSDINSLRNRYEIIYTNLFNVIICHCISCLNTQFEYIYENLCLISLLNLLVDSFVNIQARDNNLRSVLHVFISINKRVCTIEPRNGKSLEIKDNIFCKLVFLEQNNIIYVVINSSCFSTVYLLLSFFCLFVFDCKSYILEEKNISW